jgi:hypothetical protein
MGFNSGSLGKLGGPNLTKRQNNSLCKSYKTAMSSTYLIQGVTVIEKSIVVPLLAILGTMLPTSAILSDNDWYLSCRADPSRGGLPGLRICQVSPLSYLNISGTCFRVSKNDFASVVVEYQYKCSLKLRTHLNPD